MSNSYANENEVRRADKAKTISKSTEIKAKNRIKGSAVVKAIGSRLRKSNA